MFRKTCVACLAVLLVGCNGTLTTHPEMDSEKASGYEGVRFFPLAVMQTTWENTTIRDGTKVVATMWGTGDKRCSAESYVTESIDVDPTHPMILNYRHGILETYEFSVTLSEKGNLTSVNAKSTPDQGKTIDNISDAAQNFAGLAGGGAGGKGPAIVPPCTDDPKAIRMEPSKKG